MVIVYGAVPVELGKATDPIEALFKDIAQYALTVLTKLKYKNPL